jgi:hypothetical protein
MNCAARTASINLRLSAIRKLAAEAAENGLLDRSVAQGIASLQGVRQSGDRAGNCHRVLIGYSAADDTSADEGSIGAADGRPKATLNSRELYGHKLSKM